MRGRMKKMNTKFKEGKGNIFSFAVLMMSYLNIYKKKCILF